MRKYFIAVALAATLNPVAAVSQQSRFEELQRKSQNLIALIDAGERKSALCKSFETTPVKVTPISLLETKLKNLGPKSEFETTTAYLARNNAAKGAVAGTYVLSVPINREYIRYDADHRVLTVQVGAFGEGAPDQEAGIRVAIWGTIPSEVRKGRVEFPARSSEQTIRTYPASNMMGVQTTVKEVLRTSSTIMSSTKLFPWLVGEDAMVLFTAATPAQAKATMATLRLALVVEVVEPHLIVATLDAPRATLTSPVIYSERVSVLFVKPRCAILLDKSGVALQAIDTGPVE